MPEGSTAAALPPALGEKVAEVRTWFGADGCPSGPKCTAAVKAFRSLAEKKRAKPIWRPYTIKELLELPEESIEANKHAGACIRLDRFSSFDEVLEAARTSTSRRGRVTREIQKARRNGYHVKRFPKALFVPDMYEIHVSKDVRGGKAIRDRYLTSIEEMGGAPTGAVALAEPDCPFHQRSLWGVFLPEDGHRQGRVTVDERLVGYISLVGYGNHAWYARIMGHGDHLANGVMYLLHFDVVRHLLEREGGSPELLFYGAYNSGPRSGTLREWKRRCLFEPVFIVPEAGNDLGERD